MKKSFVLLIVFFVTILSISSCNYDPYSGERPFDYGEAKWASSDPVAWFEVDPADEEYYYPKGEIMVNGEFVPFYLGFINGTNSVCITVNNEDNVIDGKHLNIWGECEFSDSSLNITVDKDRDEVFGGSYDKITFSKQDVEKDIGAAIPRTQGFYILN